MRRKSVNFCDKSFNEISLVNLPDVYDLAVLIDSKGRLIAL